MMLAVIREDEATRAAESPRPSQTAYHRHLLEGEWWRRLPAFAAADEATFLDYRWQLEHTLTTASQLLETVKGVAAPAFLEDAAAGFGTASMAVRVSPYILSLIDWEHPYEDPICRQFIPTASTRLPDHPKLIWDSLAEQNDARAPGLIHRYPDRALFLALKNCPVYCRYCTRSYAVGPNQKVLKKINLRAAYTRWETAFNYIESCPELEDIVISGGDAWNLHATQIEGLGERLLAIPHVRRIRFASKGPAVMPQKLLTDDAWFRSFIHVVRSGRRLRKDVMLHTHFNHPNEITAITERAMGRLFEEGVHIRNQTVLLRGVNDSVDIMALLMKRLAYINIHPYYVYVHDLVKSVEELRTTVHTAERIEKGVRGQTAGFNTPTFVVDTPGGGGKRDVHSYEYYDRITGISVYRAPAVKPGCLFLYFDPIDQLPDKGRRRWADPSQHHMMIEEALEAAMQGGSTKPNFTESASS